MNFIEAVILIVIVIAILVLSMELGLRGIYEKLYLNVR